MVRTVRNQKISTFCESGVKNLPFLIKWEGLKVKVRHVPSFELPHNKGCICVKGRHVKPCMTPLKCTPWLDTRQRVYIAAKFLTQTNPREYHRRRDCDACHEGFLRCEGLPLLSWETNAPAKCTTRQQLHGWVMGEESKITPSWNTKMTLQGTKLDGILLTI